MTDTVSDSQTWTAIAILAMLETWLMTKLWRVKMPRSRNLSSLMFNQIVCFVKVVPRICKSCFMYLSTLLHVFLRGLYLSRKCNFSCPSFLIFIRPEADLCLPLSLTYSLTNALETWLMWPWRVKMLAQNRLLMLLMLMPRWVLMTAEIWKLKFGHTSWIFFLNFAVMVWSRFWCLVDTLKLLLGWDSEDEVWSGFV